MKKHTIQVGDRVAVYDDGIRRIGIVGQIGDSSGSQNVRVDGVPSQQCPAWKFGWFHPKQLRRLKKREPRRVWVPNSQLHDPTINFGHAWKFPPGGDDVIEFIEVKK